MVATAVKAPLAADWALSRGISALSTTELADVLSVPEDHVRRRMHAPAQRGEWVSPARGLWVPVPPEYRTWGAPPGLEIVDRLANHLGVSYYVGWLSAAEVHGAAHQAPQVFQVAVSRQVRPREVGRTRFEFFQRGHLESIPVVERATRSGTARVSTPEATALDIATDVAEAGGIDNAATVLVDLAEGDAFSVADVVRLASLFPSATVRRLGWVLEHFSQRDDLTDLHDVAMSGPATAARLDPALDLVGPLDPRWNIRLNRDVEPDL